MTTACDALVIGGGVSGAGAAYFLAERRRVILLEAESAPGYHTTGRSAALYTRHYGNPVVRLLNRASLEFLTAPPAGFSDHPLLTPRGALSIAGPDGRAAVDETIAIGAQDNGIVEVSRAQALALAPILRPDVVSHACYEEGVLAMDVDAIHQGFLRGLRARGGQVICDARVERLERRSGQWHAAAGGGEFEAPVVVNAAGAWADQVAALAGARPVGLVPKRRTAIMVDLPPGMDGRGWPAVEEAGHGSYFKPEGGRLMASPGDETPSQPCDAQPEDIDVAIIADWMERMTVLPVKRIDRKWAGLRCFVDDDRPVVGFDGEADGFFWLCGQGGYGIMMSSGLGRAAASLIARGELPPDFSALGLAAADIAPARLR